MNIIYYMGEYQKNQRNKQNRFPKTIILVGLPRSGKTSIYHIISGGENGDCSKDPVDVVYELDLPVQEENLKQWSKSGFFLFRNVDVLIFICDISTPGKFPTSIKGFVEAIKLLKKVARYRRRPGGPPAVYILLHKSDLIPDLIKRAERTEFVKTLFQEAINSEIVSYLETSIYDHSIHEALNQIETETIRLISEQLDVKPEPTDNEQREVTNNVEQIVEKEEENLLEIVEKEFINSGGNLCLNIKEFEEYFELEGEVAEKIIEELITSEWYHITKTMDPTTGKETDRLEIHPKYLRNYWLYSVLIQNEAKALLEVASLFKEPLNSQIENLEIKNQHLVKLIIQDQEIISLPVSIRDFRYLEVLDLQRCKLTYLPETIGSLSKLKMLDLDYNQLTTLPRNLGKLKNLQELWCRYNQLNSIPSTLGSLEKLQALSFENNQLSTLPESIGNLSSLQRLSLKANSLTALPTTLENLSNLKTLDLTGNPISSYPKSLEHLEDLEIRKIEKKRDSYNLQKYVLKICIIGNNFDLNKRTIELVAEQVFDTDCSPTIGFLTASHVITFQEEEIKLLFHIIRGEEYFGRLRRFYFEGSVGSIIIFDKNDRASFESVPDWWREVQGAEKPIVLLGIRDYSSKKFALDPLFFKEVSWEEGKQVADELSCEYIETTITNKMQVQEIFERLVKRIIGS